MKTRVTWIALLILACILPIAKSVAADETPRPNVLWITCEDLCPIIGCYGDPQAITPNIDALAARGVRYTNAYANAPCCSPARSCLITGVFPSRLGTLHLRSRTPKPDSIPCFTELLRAAGYWCSNNVKEDYQFATPKTAWDQSSGTAHWRGKPSDAPFFSVFNFVTTHQSRPRYPDDKFAQLTKDVTDEQRHDPATIALPPYYPDTPAIRKIVANLYDATTQMDYQVGQILKQLEEDGLADDTIVFFYSDHGSGIPRGKRWLHDTGLVVPLVVYFPPKYAHLAPTGAGETSDRIVNFVDFPTTVLSLVGLDIPEHMQGVAFLGKQAGPERKYTFAARDRVDEVYEMSRAISDGRYKYIRNYYPHRPRMPYSTYSEQTPIRPEIRRLDAAGKLSGPTVYLAAETKPAEEFFDTQADPWEMNNLIDDPAHADRIARMKARLRCWMISCHDTGFLPEAEVFSRCNEGETPYEMVAREDGFDVAPAINAANLVGTGAGSLDKMTELLGDDDSAVRFWATVAIDSLGAAGKPAADALEKIATTDPAPVVRIAAAEPLAKLGRPDVAREVLESFLENPDENIRLQTFSTIERLAPLAAPSVERLRQIIATEKGPLHGMYGRWALQRAIQLIEQ